MTSSKCNSFLFVCLRNTQFFSSISRLLQAPKKIDDVKKLRVLLTAKKHFVSFNVAVYLMTRR